MEKFKLEHIFVIRLTQLCPRSLMRIDDVIGMFFGYYSLLVYQIQAVYITLFLWNRDLLTFYCCFTHLLSEIMNYVLKHSLKHPRPDHGAPGGGLFEGRYGMPSQHCHCFAYLITMVLLLVFHYYRQHVDSTKKILVLTISTIGLTLQVFGRIYLRFHTVNQCLAGVSFGITSAITFYFLGLNYFLPYGDQLCKIPILQFFSFRKDLISSTSNSYQYSTHNRSKFPQCRSKNE